MLVRHSTATALLFAATVVAVLAVTEEAQATANCSLPVADRCQGMSMVGTVTGGTASGRCFFWTTLNTAPPCSAGGIGTTSNQAWEVDAGGCQTWYYWDVANGLVPPAVPNKLSLRVYFDTIGPAYKTFILNAAEPVQDGVANAYTWCATDTGNAGGNARAGTSYFEIVAVKDNGNGLPGNTNYALASSGVGAQDTSFDAGGARARTFVSALTASAPASGTIHAYGPGGDEAITITSTFTPPVQDANVETMHNSILDEATLAIGQAGAVVDVDSGTLAQSPFVADQTFPFANNPYVAGFTVDGNSGLLGLKGTTLAATGHASCFVRVSDTFGYCNTDLTIDPRVKMDSDGMGGFAAADETDRSYVGGICTGTLVELFNRLEGACTAWGAYNARDELLSRAMTFVRRDPSNTVCASYGSVTPTANVYTVSGNFANGPCAAAADTTGTARHLLMTNTDQSYVSGTVYYVSSFYHVNPWTDLEDTRGATPDLQFFVRSDGAGGDDTDAVHHDCEVKGVRDDVAVDTSGSAVSQQLKDPTGATRATRTTDTGPDGWTPTSQDLLATTPLGDDWTAPCSVAFNGNVGSDVLTFEVGVEGGGGGETVYTGADPLTLFCGDVSNGTVPCAAHSRLLNGAARIGAAGSIHFSVFDWPAMTPVLTGQAATEVDPVDAPGAYAYAFTPPYHGSFLVSVNTTDGATAIGAHNVITMLETSDVTVNVEDATAALWPLWLALGILAVGVLPTKRNQGVIAFSGLLFMFAAAATDFTRLGFDAAQTEGTRSLVALLGLFVLLASGLVIQDEVVAARERKRAEEAES